MRVDVTCQHGLVPQVPPGGRSNRATACSVASNTHRCSPSRSRGSPTSASVVAPPSFQLHLNLSFSSSARSLTTTSFERSGRMEVLHARGPSTQVEGAPVQRWQGSIKQLGSQPSPASRLPSSHASPASTTPSPHDGEASRVTVNLISVGKSCLLLLSARTLPSDCSATATPSGCQTGVGTAKVPLVPYVVSRTPSTRYRATAKV